MDAEPSRIREARALSKYQAPLNIGSRFGFPKQTGWCEVISHLAPREQFAWFLEIQSDLDHGRVQVDGLGDCLLLSGYSYLGLNRRPEIKKAILAALDRFGSGSAGSRWLAGHTSLHHELEELLAEVHHAEDAVTFASGYVTNVSVLSSLLQKGDVVFGDRINHASLVDGCRYSGAKFTRFPHNDMRTLRGLLEKSSPLARKLVAVDGVASMSGSVCNAKELCELCEEFKAIILLDECHSHFVLGQTGGGVREYCQLSDAHVVDLEMGSLGKALFAAGGYIAASSDLCTYLRREARGFIYSRSISPVDVAAGLAALKIFQKERVELVQALNENCRVFRKALRTEGLIVDDGPTPIVAIPIGPAAAAVDAAVACQKRQIFIHPVFPPVVPAGKAIMRASIMANHRPRDLVAAAAVIAEEVTRALRSCSSEDAAIL